MLLMRLLLIGATPMNADDEEEEQYWEDSGVTEQQTETEEVIESEVKMQGSIINRVEAPDPLAVFGGFK